MPEAGVAFEPLAARGFDRSRPWTLVTSSVLAVVSTARALRLIRRYRPDAVVGFGGYVSIPVGLAAVLRRVPLVLHEQNSVPGLANRLLSRWARATAVTYPESVRRLKHPDRAVLTGNPVRAAVLSARAEKGRALLGVPQSATLLLAFGGSRGARHLNTALIAVGARVLSVPDVRVVQVAGRAEADTVRTALAAAGFDLDERWQVLDYIEDMGSAMAAADLVLSRAGATSLAEITALGRPALLVPYPHATDDHQTTNAAALVEAGAAEVVADAELDSPRFGDTLLRLLSGAGSRATMAAASQRLACLDAAARVAGMARKAAAGRMESA